MPLMTSLNIVSIQKINVNKNLRLFCNKNPWLKNQILPYYFYIKFLDNKTANTII
ncbi:hypothetical protein KsCSTR_17000 [Candidatus Kuenenia stuttgartiensis]|uniref:Uncharacterized protein n=1 Tax=Kuenenia stuttgartiensis TaxID=174633 RepID=Q1Q219_KUEST|nr:hypothetical protein KsCSTR_17000 [Candidatus Kuenenia stuttgartiensis]CAJ74048.1 unknown protein [Candidatus Kuenenia stuttgartiensis]